MPDSSSVRERRAGALQGVLLLLPITMPVMGIVVLSPALPSMQAHFHSVAGVEYWVPLALTVPALCIALLSPMAGAIVDRFGRRRTLLLALLLYAVVGMLPLVLESLGAIIASRVLLGAMEAAIVTSSTTLIGDYFHGAQRERWLGLQTGVASASSIVLFAIGGALGNISWRGPFAIYGVSLLLMLALLAGTWEPRRSEQPADELAVGSAFPWGTLARMCLIALFGGVMFFTLQIQLAYLLTDHYGIRAPGTIGLLTAIASVAVLLGALTIRQVTRYPVAVQLLLAFGLIGVGFVLINHAPTTVRLMTYVVINQFGCGLLLPTLVVWVMSRLPFDIRGRGTGWFMASFWIGEFLSPLVVTALTKETGGLPATLQLFGEACLAAALLAAVASLRRRSVLPAPAS